MKVVEPRGKTGESPAQGVAIEPFSVDAHPFHLATDDRRFDLQTICRRGQEPGVGADFDPVRDRYWRLVRTGEPLGVSESGPPNPESPTSSASLSELSSGSPNARVQASIRAARARSKSTSPEPFRRQRRHVPPHQPQGLSPQSTLRQRQDLNHALVREAEHHVADHRDAITDPPGTGAGDLAIADREVVGAVPAGRSSPRSRKAATAGSRHSS